MEMHLPRLAAHTARPDAAEPLRENVDGDLRLFAVGAVLAQALDAVSGAWMMHTRGLAAELNPLVRAVFVACGAPAVVTFKVALALGAAALFITLAGTGRGRLARLFLLLAAGAGLLGFWSNLP